MKVASLADTTRDRILTLLQKMPDTWAKLGEARERAQIEMAAQVAKQIINECMDRIVSSEDAGVRTLDCRLGKVTINDKSISAPVSVAIEDDLELDMGRAANAPAKIVLVRNRKDLLAENTRPEARTDQIAMFPQTEELRTAEAISEGLKQHEGPALPDPKAAKERLQAGSDDAPKPVKRGRGRPRKATTETKVVATGRGRARKKSEVQVVRKPAAASDGMDLVE